MMLTLLMLMEIFIYGMAILGLMLDRLLVQQVQRVLQVVMEVLLLKQQHHLQTHKMVTHGLTPLMERFMFITILIG